MSASQIADQAWNYSPPSSFDEDDEEDNHERQQLDLYEKCARLRIDTAFSSDSEDSSIDSGSGMGIASSPWDDLDDDDDASLVKTTTHMLQSLWSSNSPSMDSTEASESSEDTITSRQSFDDSVASFQRLAVIPEEEEDEEEEEDYRQTPPPCHDNLLELSELHESFEEGSFSKKTTSHSNMPFSPATTKSPTSVLCINLGCLPPPPKDDNKELHQQTYQTIRALECVNALAFFL